MNDHVTAALIANRLKWGDPVWDLVRDCRARFANMANGVVTLLDNDGRPLPHGHRFPEQVRLYSVR